MHQGFADEFLHSGALISLGEQSVAIGWGEPQWLKTPPPESAFSFYFPDFFLQEERPWLVFEKVQEISLQELQKSLSSAQNCKPLSWQPADQLLFEWQCAEVFQRIQKGQLQKAVPYVCEKSSAPFSLAHCHRALYSCLERAQKCPLALYGFWNEREGMLGATPELLFRQMHGKVETCAVAGTVNASTQWQDDQKLKKEHEIVVRGIIESLSPFGRVSVGETSLVAFSHLGHLKTPMELSSPSLIHFEELVTALHPTPALGAYPREEGWVWLKEVQRLLDRRRYGAPIGVKGENEQCWVGIRNVQWQEGEVKLFAGCGYVAESDVGAEWNELQMKLKIMKEILAL